MSKLLDQYGREINYVRLAVTDRCNLRCFYCMPNGIQYEPKNELMNYEEMLRVISLLGKMGISKIRITGGEPFLRKDLIYFIQQIHQIQEIKDIHITTNGTLTHHIVDQFKSIGIKSVNLSLDSLDEERFFQITKRKELNNVLKTLEQLLQNNITTKINAVVMKNKNEEDIIPLIELTKNKNISVRFIEEMPFNSTGNYYENLDWNYKKIIDYIQKYFPSLYKIKDAPFSTSFNYKIKNFQGSIGVIPAYSRTFCGSCNRIRITPKGILKTCLYDEGVFNIKNLIRNGATDEQLKFSFLEAISHKYKNGHEAEKNRINSPLISESMTTIGG